MIAVCSFLLQLPIHHTSPQLGWCISGLEQFLDTTKWKLIWNAYYLDSVESVYVACNHFCIQLNYSSCYSPDLKIEMKYIFKGL